MSEIDIAIVGGGACGVMTALRASLDPDLVIGVFEKDTHGGSNTEISSGSLAAGGTRFQREAGIADSPAQHARDILAASGDDGLADLVHALCEAAPAYVEWIADDLGYPLEIGADMLRAGMSVPRLHSDVGRKGGGRLMRHLKAELAGRENVAFVDRSPAVALVVDEGRVGGIVIEQNGQTSTVHAAAVVLALDGFAGNRTLLERYCPQLGDTFYGGVSNCTGDAIPWLLALDVDLINMGACLRHGLVVDGYGTRVSPALQFNGAIFLNLDAERFVDEESVSYSKLAGLVQAQPGERATVVWDAAAMAATRETELMRESLNAGAIRDFPDGASLAAWLDTPVSHLDEVLTPLPGRRRLEPPFNAARITHGVLVTQGGARVDPRGRVLRRDGRLVPGLRAGGGTAVGLAGPDSSGYSSGNGLLSAFGMGWIIGNDLRACHPASEGATK